MGIVATVRRFLDSDGFTHLLLLVARVLLGVPFPIFGVRKLLNPEHMSSLIETAGIPGQIVWFIIPYQILCGLAVWLGFHTRWAAFLLGGFCIVAPLLYHTQWSQPHELAEFTKDFATAGGFLFLWRFGPGRFSIDALRGGGLKKRIKNG
jgi:putative oxidoreductase